VGGTVVVEPVVPELLGTAAVAVLEPLDVPDPPELELEDERLELDELPLAPFDFSAAI
jgi:hypothetical protein